MNVDCRIFVYDGKEYEQPPVAMIIDGNQRVLYGQSQNVKASYELTENLKNYYIRRESIMKTMSIYEPAMCCETGLCGVGVDPELLRISSVFSTLEKNGVIVKRYNLNNFPQEFMNNLEINKLINDDGVESLPATVVDGKIVKTKKYPTNVEIAELLEIPTSYLESEASKVKEAPKKQDGGCDCKGGCC